MAGTINGNEAKLRAYELPALTDVAAAQGVAVDGPSDGSPQSGPGFALAPVLTQAGLKQLPYKSLTDIGSSVSKVPLIVGDNPSVVGLYGLQEVIGAYGTMYLGPKVEAPTTDNAGAPLQTGHSYYNTLNGQLYVFSPGGRWAEAGSSLTSAVSLYYYQLSVDGAVIPPDGAGQPDSFGNVLSFDIAAGQTARNQIAVYVNGALQVGGADYVLYEGGAGGDYLVLARNACATSVVVVQVFHAASAVFSPSSVKINTSGWVYTSGVSTYPLVDQSGNPIVPQSAVNVLVVNGNVVLEPGIDFTVSGSNIIFTEPLDPDIDRVWIVVGIPQAGFVEQDETVHTTAFTLARSMSGHKVPCNGTFTITVPAASELGPNFDCDIIVLGGTVTINGPGATNPTAAANSRTRIMVIGSTIYTNNMAMTAIT